MSHNHIKVTRSGKFHFIVEVYEGNKLLHIEKVRSSDLTETVWSLRQKHPQFSIKGLPQQYQEYQPSAEEIEAKCAEIRKSWTATMLRVREVSKQPDMYVKYANASVARKKFN